MKALIFAVALGALMPATPPKPAPAPHKIHSVWKLHEEAWDGLQYVGKEVGKGVKEVGKGVVYVAKHL